MYTANLHNFKYKTLTVIP